MRLMIAGLVVWSAAHIFPAVAPGTRDTLDAKLGRQLYRGLFSLIIIGSLLMIVVGWRQAEPAHVYPPPLEPGAAVAVLMLIAFILFIAAQARTNIKRILRHPQLTGVVVWAVAHLLANGDRRSVVLFVALGTWAVLEMLMINRRDGSWMRPAPAPLLTDVVVAAIGAIAFAFVLYFHERLFGVPSYAV